MSITYMLDFSQMFIRLALALLLGALIGIEREVVGKKEAGIRTTMLVSGGAAIFSMIGLTLPYIIAPNPESVAGVITGSSGFLSVIANIVVGIGFLGGGIIIKNQEHVHGVTTAALIWVSAAIGILAGIGLFSFAIASAVILAGLLYLLRDVKVRKVG